MNGIFINNQVQEYAVNVTNVSLFTNYLKSLENLKKYTTHFILWANLRHQISKYITKETYDFLIIFPTEQILI